MEAYFIGKLGEKHMKFKLNALEKKWILYDVGNSAFTLLVSTIMPIYFNALAESAGLSDVSYLAYWGYAVSASTILVALLGPTIGTFSDLRGWKKPIFLISLLIGAIGCVLLGILQSWFWFLLLFILAKSAYSLSLVLYDSMLIDVTTEDRMDQVSSHGYAWGYIGSCLPFVLCLVLVLCYDAIGLSMGLAMGLAFALIAVWWVLLSPAAIEKLSAKPLCRILRKTVRIRFGRLASVLKRTAAAKKGTFLPACLFLFYRRRLYRHRYGNRLRHRIRPGYNRPSIGPARNSNRCLPRRAVFWPPFPSVFLCQAYARMHSRLLLYIPLCHRDGAPVPILDLGCMRRHLSGRHSVLIAFLLCQNHSSEPFRRVFRPIRYLR